ncbi:MAG: zinc-ribbon domain-containing protein, partial [Pseudomonadota bacterium]
MRLTCPNCGAQYEVPDEVIPEAGRDVQCSNCGTTWFQAHPDHPVEAPEPANLDDELAQFAVEPEPEP